MTKDQLELLREYVRAEIDYALANCERDDEGYTTSHLGEKRAADSTFTILVDSVCPNPDGA